MNNNNNSNSDNNNSSVPQENPILTAYEEFCNSCPLVCRYILHLSWSCFFLSFFVNVEGALANYPLHTIRDFEIYRILTSILASDSLLSLIFSSYSFNMSGKKMELLWGSSKFGATCIQMLILTNSLYVVVAYVISFLSSPMLLVTPSNGLWDIVFFIMAVECGKAPLEQKRRLFIVDVPTVYYPSAVLCLFTLLAGLHLNWFVSVSLGYLYIHGKLPQFLSINPSRFKQWETRDSGVLYNFTQRQGWVSPEAGNGTGVYASSNNNNNDSQAQAQSWTSGGVIKKEKSSNKNEAHSFPSSGGITLGNSNTTSARSRPNATSNETARAARLARLERQQQVEEEGQNDDGGLGV